MVAVRGEQVRSKTERVDRASYGLEPTVKIDGTLLPVRKKREGNGRDPPKTFLYAGPWRSPRVSRCAVCGAALACSEQLPSVWVGRALAAFFFLPSPSHRHISACLTLEPGRLLAPMTIISLFLLLMDWSRTDLLSDNPTNP